MTPPRALCLCAAFAGALLAGAAQACSAAEILVSAATSLTNALRDVGQRFEAQHPGDTVRFNFAASDVLLAQIDKGAPADVFASADEATMDRAERAGRVVRGARRDFASNALVIVVPRGGTHVASIAALREAEVHRVAIGSPRSVPAGRYAKEALVDAGAWDALQPKLVLAQNVRQVLDYVARGEVDAGFVYATDAAIMPDRVVVSVRPATRDTVRYPVAPLTDSRQPALAGAFVSFLASPQAQAVLARYGFAPPAAP
ncbi:MAG TPA: molybdate ABC transporter substrate-binding protein [Casimicrobiaceae bacterium]|nr:molybdate ABC transporter substrate-binding protein [Casimicrobiaceae bacterium]